MKILTEKEQKQKKMVELSQLKNKLMLEAETIRSIKNKELKKLDRFFYPTEPNWKVVHDLDERIIVLYSAAETLIEYRNLIEESIKP